MATQELAGNNQPVLPPIYIGGKQQTAPQHEETNDLVLPPIHIGSPKQPPTQTMAFGSQPDLFVAAHEAAHVVQQRGEVQLKSGFGQTGDRYEQHADSIADRVVRGESAESLLSQTSSPGASGSSSAVQFNMLPQQPTFSKTPPPDSPSTIRKTTIPTDKDSIVNMWGSKDKDKDGNPQNLKKPVVDDDTGEIQTTMKQVGDSIWEKGLEAGQTALNKNKNKPAKQRELAVIKAVLTAVRQPLTEINKIKHPGCTNVTAVILGVLKKLGIEGEAYLSKKSGHTLPFFKDAGVGLKHGDDLYSKGGEDKLSVEKLLLTKPQIEQHYRNEQKLTKHVRDVVKHETQNPTNVPLILPLPEFTAVSRYRSKGPMDRSSHPTETVTVRFSEIMNHPDFNKRLLKYYQPGNSDNRLTLAMIKSAFTGCAKPLSSAARGYTKGDFAKSPQELLSLFAKACKGKLMGMVVGAELSPKDSRFAPLKQKLRQTTYNLDGNTP